MIIKISYQTLTKKMINPFSFGDAQSPHLYYLLYEYLPYPLVFSKSHDSQSAPICPGIHELSPGFHPP